MNVLNTAISGVLLLEPVVREDERGCFFETYRQDVLDALIGGAVRFVQDNRSRSRRGVLRGLHYQLPPRAQGKLVQVVDGEIYDVAVDLRRESATFGQWVGEVLSAGNRRQMWIPPGFAHGFYVLSAQAEVFYKTSDYYSPAHERCIAWDDPELAIAWPLAGMPLMSPRDRSAQTFREGIAEMGRGS